MKFAIVFLSFLSIVAPHRPTIAEEKHLLRTFETKQLEEKFYSEAATFGDLNNDKKIDLVAGPFWYEGPEFKKKHAYNQPKAYNVAKYSEYFVMFVDDLNGDQWNDILVIGFPGKDASWFENPKGKNGQWTRHTVFDVVDNESPTWADITGDGKKELVCNHEQYLGYAMPDWNAPEQSWTFHPISGRNASYRNFTHGLGVGDLNQDGHTDVIEKNGWWEQPAKLDGDPEWKFHRVKFSDQEGGAQMHAYDVDGDGLNDVVTSIGAHHYGLSWFRQEQAAKSEKPKEIRFTEQRIMGTKPADNPYGLAITQPHAVDLVDMNGDGLKDIITGKRWWNQPKEGTEGRTDTPYLYWFELSRKKNKDGSTAVDWIPHQVSDSAGVGTQVVAADFNDDQLPDIVSAHKKGTFVYLQKTREVSKEEFEKKQFQPRVDQTKTTEK
jgi:hypothetical protein